ncbi:MAG: RNA polymerase factor sigma-32, partial [Alphaproteobacteria bacterium]|nr:RNA polymerase factor sigma-32 [Alphaproteobacteria bacterium]
MTQTKALALAVPLPLVPADGLRRYLQEINRFPMLTLEQEQALSRAWRNEGDIAAAHQLVTSHLRLVAKLALKYRGYGLPVSELIAEGNIGLMQAVKRFEPERGFRLATYAIWWIKAAIQEYVLRSWSLVKIGSSAAQKRLFFNLRKMKRKIGHTHGVELTDEQIGEIARILDVSKEDVVDMDQRMNATDVFLNSPAAVDSDEEKMDFLMDTGDSQEVQLARREEEAQRHRLLMSALQTL